MSTVVRISRLILLAGLAAFALSFIVAALDFVGPWTGLALCMYSLFVAVAAGVTYAGAKLLVWAKSRRQM